MAWDSVVKLNFFVGGRFVRGGEESSVVLRFATEVSVCVLDQYGGHIIEIKWKHYSGKIIESECPCP
jgi:hypothetical protein